MWVRRSFASTRSPLMGGDTPTPCACGKICCKKYTPAPLALPKYTPGYPFRVLGGECVSRDLSALYR